MRRNRKGRNPKMYEGFMVTLSFDALPIWRGTSDLPGRYSTLPFAIGCGRDGLVRQVMQPAVQQEIIRTYADREYHHMTPVPGSSSWANRLADENINALLNAVGTLDGKRVLEIGAGSLYVAELLRREFRISDYVVVDPAIDMQEAPSSSRVRTVADYFPCAAIDGETFHVILSFSTLEHVPDPLEFLAACRRHVVDDGFVFVVCPDVTQQFTCGDLNAFVHEHLSFFDEDSLIQAFSSAGFQIQSLKSANDTFFVSARKGDPMAEDTQRSARALLRFTDAVARYTKVLEGLGTAIEAVLQQDRRVVFHGATGGLNTFLHFWPPVKPDFVAIVDSDHAKHGRFLPVFEHPITAPKADVYRSADLVIVSALGFYDEIRRSIEATGIDDDRILRLDVSSIDRLKFLTHTVSG